MKRLLPLCFFSLVLIASGSADAMPDFSQITRALCQQLSHPEAPLVDSPECGGKKRLFGGSLTIAYKGRIIYEVATGAADVDGSEMVHRGSLFRVASLHKPITAIGIMRLVQDGRLDLNAPVFGNRVLHGVNGIISAEEIVRDIKPGAGVLTITVDHLLRQASGWPETSSYAPFALRKARDQAHPYGIAGRFETQNRADLDTLVRYMANLSPTEPPGEKYNYNNMNYVVLNKVIEVASGLSYEEYFRQYIFEPLGIRSIKPAKTFLADRYSNEVQYIWPSFTEPSNLHEQYCTGEKVPSQYGLFRLEGNWIASPRGLISLFDAIDLNIQERTILDERTIEMMFSVERISRHNVARGWSNVDRSNANRGDWSFTGGNAGTAARFMKTRDGFKIAYLRNASPNVAEQSQSHSDKGNPKAREAFDVQWNPRWLTETALREVRKISKRELENVIPASPPATTSEWKDSSLSIADIQAGCQAKAIEPCSELYCSSDPATGPGGFWQRASQRPSVLLCSSR